MGGHEITGYFSNLTEDDRRDENNYELDEDEGDSNGSSSDSYSENNEDDDEDESSKKNPTKKKNVRFPNTSSSSSSSSSSKNEMPIPVLPSKNLILGFISLAARNLRSWLQPHDILRWVQNGLTSYNCFLQRMPSDIKVSKYCRYVFNHSCRRIFPSPSNIMYHMCALAHTLD